ncbi:MAG: hypothetical protein IC227_01195 [Enterococcus lacertideformus]|uniref:DUF2187 domain-containing protein n=1 Tax=Enterococcus lacertideformus TaxID=2771493 RepID=A0A931FAB3_9ENTE|nr:hypothetical protein [Enterococcus lacertideformus]
MFIGDHVTAINLYGEEVTGVIEKILIHTVIIRAGIDAVLIKKKKEVKAIINESSIAKTSVMDQKIMVNSEEMMT